MQQTAAERLEELGLDGQQVLGICFHVAHHYCRRTGSGLDARIEDLVQHLALNSARIALTYESARSGEGYTFASYLHDVLQRRCVDWHRSKAAGFGDRRYGHDKRIELAGDTISDLVKYSAPEPFADADLHEAAADMWHDRGLSDAAGWALVNVAPLIVEGASEYHAIRVAARQAGIRMAEARRRLEQLRGELKAGHALAA